MEKQPLQVDKREKAEQRPKPRTAESEHSELQEFIAAWEESAATEASIEDARMAGADVGGLKTEFAQAESELMKLEGEGSSETRFLSLEERREKKLTAFFERREKQAQAIIKWMRLLEQVDVPSDEGVWPAERIKNDEQLFQSVLQKDLEDLPPTMQAACERVWGLWALRVRNARRNVEALLGSPASKEVEIDPEAQGETLFEKRVNSSPVGKVRFFHKGPFFYFTFEQRSDYERLRAAVTGSDERTEEGGVFIEEAYWGKSKVPTLLQIGKEVDPHILAHEGQHFLNDALGEQFKSWEAGTDQSKLVQAERAVKDELLAYVREGRPPKEIRKILLEDPLYAHLYRDVDERESALLKQELQKICTVLETHPWAQSSATIREAADRTKQLPRVDKHQREMIVANLLDVPLPKMEKYLNQSAKFYGEKIHRMEPPPLPLEPKATASEQRQWKEEQNAFVAQYNQLLGLVPEYGLLDPQSEEHEASLDGPPPLPPENASEDLRRYEREMGERANLQREKEKRRRRLDEV